MRPGIADRGDALLSVKIGVIRGHYLYRQTVTTFCARECQKSRHFAPPDRTDLHDLLGLAAHRPGNSTDFWN
jgi:hypothetical protein